MINESDLCVKNISLHNLVLIQKEELLLLKL